VTGPTAAFKGATVIRAGVLVGKYSAFADIHASTFMGRLEGALRAFAQPAAVGVCFGFQRMRTFDPEQTPSTQAATVR
jgi:hypothetical protein